LIIPAETLSAQQQLRFGRRAGSLSIKAKKVASDRPLAHLVKSTLSETTSSEQNHFDFKIGTNQFVLTADLPGSTIDEINTVGFS
jgi:hypothetical protein